LEHDIQVQSVSYEQNKYNPRGQNLESKQRQICKDIQPTVLWIGNGYHIYLPIQARILDTESIFSKDDYPNLFSNYNCKYSNYSVSDLFLKFAENFFTGGKADPQHHPKYKTCLIRIPNTFNSKGLAKNEESTVNIIRKWNGYRLPIQILTKDFWRWLTQEEIDQGILNKKNKDSRRNNSDEATVIHIGWIENLLQTPISDYRKYCLWRIVIPYLKNIRKLETDESISVANQWLQNCDNLRKLEFNPLITIKNNLKNVNEY